MKTTAINNLKEIEKEENRIKVDPANLKEDYRKMWRRVDCAIMSNNDLGNYVLHKVEDVVKRDVTEEEIEKIKNIIIANDYEKFSSIEKVQEEFNIEFNMFDFEKKIVL